VPDERREEAKLERRQLDLAVADRDPSLRPVDGEIRIRVGVGLQLARTAAGGPAQERA
jgi:hypothetical protein